jgi:GT2 family glycosyltransferase
MRCVKAVAFIAEHQKDVTEILVVSNGPETVRQTIQSLFAGVSETPYWKIHLHHTTQMGFSPACNMGLKYAQGQYLVLLNDDAIPGVNMFQDMLGAMATAEACDPSVRVGFAGPMLNRVKGGQQLDDKVWPFIHDPNNVDMVGEKLREQVKKHGRASGDMSTLFPLPAGFEPTPFVTSGDISGVCLLITRECYKAVGALTVYGKGGFEDNDFCLRALEKGFLGVQALTAFAYHDMNVTYGKIDPGNKNSTATLQEYVERWYVPKKKTLCVSYYVKLDTEPQVGDFLASVARMRTLADQIVIFDDRSVFSAEEALWGYGFDNSKKTFVITRKEEGEQNEPADRNTLLIMARATGCDWIWNLDHDEYPDARLTPELLQRLLNPINPQIMSYIIPLATYWRGLEKIRIDGVWGKMKNRSFFRNLPAFGSILPYVDSPFHCERAPALMPGNVKAQTFAFSVEHTGYYEYAQVKAKQKHYQTRDTCKAKWLIGSEDYEHLTNEGELSLLPFGTPTTTLLMMCRNERHDVLKSLYLHAHMFNEVQVISNGSVDGTIELCRRLQIPIASYACCDQFENPDHMTCDFSLARNTAIEYCNTDYIMFQDPDEELDIESMLYFDKLLLENFDAYLVNIRNFNYDKKKELTVFMTKQPRLFRNRPEIRYNDGVHEVTEQAFIDNPQLKIGPSPLFNNHYGYLRTSPAARKKRNEPYAQKLLKLIEKEPDNYRALHALAIHFRDNGDTEMALDLMNRSIVANGHFFTSRWDLALLYIDEIYKLIATLDTKARPESDDPRWQAAVMLMRDIAKYAAHAA